MRFIAGQREIRLTPPPGSSSSPRHPSPHCRGLNSALDMDPFSHCRLMSNCCSPSWKTICWWQGFKANTMQAKMADRLVSMTIYVCVNSPAHKCVFLTSLRLAISVLGNQIAVGLWKIKTHYIQGVNTNEVQRHALPPQCECNMSPVHSSKKHKHNLTFMHESSQTLTSHLTGLPLQLLPINLSLITAGPSIQRPGLSKLKFWSSGFKGDQKVYIDTNFVVEYFFLFEWCLIGLNVFLDASVFVYVFVCCIRAFNC